MQIVNLIKVKYLVFQSSFTTSQSIMPVIERVQITLKLKSNNSKIKLINKQQIN